MNRVNIKDLFCEILSIKCVPLPQAVTFLESEYMYKVCKLLGINRILSSLACDFKVSDVETFSAFQVRARYSSYKKGLLKTNSGLHENALEIIKKVNAVYDGVLSESDLEPKAEPAKEESNDNGQKEEVVADNEAEKSPATDEITAESLMKKAAEVMRKRAIQYDQEGGERSLPKVVKAFNALTDMNMSEADAALFMVLLKIVRGRNSKHEDSAVDGVAYMSLYAEAQMKGDGE